MTPFEFRQAVRHRDFRAPTAGYCGDYAQANLAILPAAHAHDFLRFCHANPKPCPLLGVGEPGDFRVPMLGRDIDIRSDVPAYNVYRDGQLSERVESIEALWQDDFVVFAIGCSFSFEHMLAKEGIGLRHVEEGRNVPMYRTKVPNQRAGVFGGELVVSMRPLRGADAIRAVQITSRFPGVHGAPVHIGDPAELGIADLARPEFGDAVTIRAGELPVYWACGVTPQTALMAAKLPIAIAHAPGHMLMTDITNASLAIF
ncbi:putative hydro-lyase [Paraburkholderia sp. MMS20-SJTR3]|uniref:Putative hydro-lyase LJ656_06980 n=1 Tax=Paraburkholderia sejongensis TaxID=2886946 RepID=A0ABS8JR26_9BURK|nr:putative hydro-lyase [Paraburkholderia sp. MMS20-SJTR3]MCC8392327.1 putative hydro-lyase [Paraburkholderia sp. MMS20-SJTR3]